MENDADLSGGHNHSAHAHGHGAHHEHGGAAAAHGGHGDMGHGMFFRARVTETILFEGWVVSRTEQLVGSCLVIFLLGLLFEALKHLRACLLHTARTRPGDKKGQRLAVPSSEAGVGVRVAAPPRVAFLARACNRHHLAQTLLYILQFVIGYLLMLVFMTYNVWLCLAVVAGIGTGFLLFGASDQFPEASPAAEVQNGDCGCH